MTYHEHPLRVLRYSMRNLWLLIFPLLRGFSVFHFDPEGIYQWVKGAWADILILIAILVFGFIRWYCTEVEVSIGSVTYREGVIFKVVTDIPFNNISVSTAESPAYLIPFHGVRLSFDTRAGFFRTTDLKLLMTKKHSLSILENIPDINVKNKQDIQDPSGLSVLLFSLFFSSGFSGAVYIATFFIKGGDIAHDLILLSLNTLAETTEKISSNFILKIPGAALAAGTFFLAAWLLSFFVNIQRYSRFRINCDEKVLNVTCGLFNRRSYRINLDHINFTDLRQNLIMKMTGIVTVNISCAGYGTSSQHMPVLLPVRLEKNLGKGLERLGLFSGIKLEFKPRRSGWWNYVWMPFLSAVIILPLSDSAAKLFPRISELIHFSGMMLMIPAVWLVAVKTVALLTSGISLYEDKILIRCSKWTSFHTVAADRENIVKIDIMQSPFQRFLSHKCCLSFWLCGEGVTKYSVRAMDLKDAIRIARLLGYRPE